MIKIHTRSTISILPIFSLSRKYLAVIATELKKQNPLWNREEIFYKGHQSRKQLCIMFSVCVRVCVRACLKICMISEAINLLLGVPRKPFQSSANN